MKISFIKRSVKGSLNIEGIKPSKVGEAITEKFLEGKISSEEARKKIIEYHLNKGGGGNE